MKRTIDFSDKTFEFDVVIEDGRPYFAGDDLIDAIGAMLDRVPRWSASGRSIHNFLGGFADDLIELDQSARIADLQERSSRL